MALKLKKPIENSVPDDRKISPARMSAGDRLQSPGPDLLKRMDELPFRGLSPSTALELLGLLIPWVLNAAKEDMDRLKMIDKCLNTARGLMETQVKTEEAQVIAARLDELEHRIESLLHSFRQ